MAALQYRKRAPRTDLFCRNADNQIVVVSKLWKGHSKEHSAVSLYVVRGNKGKKLELIHRELFAKPDFSVEALLTACKSVPLLWAMHFGIEDFVVVHQEPNMSRMYHPSHFEQESQP